MEKTESNVMTSSPIPAKGPVERCLDYLNAGTETLLWFPPSASSFLDPLSDYAIWRQEGLIDLSQRAGLTAEGEQADIDSLAANLKLLSALQAAGAPGPACHFVAAHGLLSWVTNYAAALRCAEAESTPIDDLCNLLSETLSSPLSTPEAVREEVPDVQGSLRPLLRWLLDTSTVSYTHLTLPTRS